jgi:hypothetical protein
LRGLSFASNFGEDFDFQFIQQLFLKQMGCKAPNETLIARDELRFYVEVRKGGTLHTILVEKHGKNRPLWRFRRDGQYINPYPAIVEKMVNS